MLWEYRPVPRAYNNALIDTREIIVYMDSPWSKLIVFHFVTLSSPRKTLKKLQISAFFHIFISNSVHIAKSRKTEKCFFILDKILKKMRYHSFKSDNYFLRCGPSKIDHKCSKNH